MIMQVYDFVFTICDLVLNEEEFYKAFYEIIGSRELFQIIKIFISTSPNDIR